MKKRTVALVMAVLCIAIVVTPTIILLEPTGKFFVNLLESDGISPWFFIAGVAALSGIVTALLVMRRKRSRL